MSRVLLAAMAALLLLPGMAAAADLLFRGDSRPPEQIFAEGFTGAGANRNVLEHLAGRSCFDATSQQARSAFVSMTSRADDATWYGTYVYRITPDSTAIGATATYDAVASLRHMSTFWQHHRLNILQRSTIDSALRLPATDGQHVAERIPREWIQSVDIYEYDPDHGLVLSRNERNPHYREPDTIGTQPAFSPDLIAIIQGVAPPTRMQYMTGPNGTEVAACMVPSTSNCSAAQPQRFAGNPLQCATWPGVLPDSLFWQATMLLLD